LKLYLAFLVVFLMLGLSTRSLGAWSYLAIGGASVLLTGVYLFSTSAWA